MLKKYLKIATILSSMLLLFLSCDRTQPIDNIVDYAYPAVDVIINDSGQDIEIIYTETETETDGNSRVGNYKVESRCLGYFVLSESDNFGIYNSDTLKVVFLDGKEVTFSRYAQQELNPYNDLKGVLTDHEGKRYIKYEVLVTDQMYNVAQ